MATTKRLVCLANSRKTGGRCVAGKELKTGLWIRPIGRGPDQELSPSARRYPDGSEPALLDVFDLGLGGPTPGTHQPENWALDKDVTWQRVGNLAIEEVEPYLDHPTSLWTNTSSSGDGLNDRVPESAKVGQSLYLVLVEELIVDVRDSWKGGMTVRADFRYEGDDYRLAVTDPVVEAAYSSQPGQHELGPAYVTVSLGEAWHGYCYKLIAGVIPMSTPG